LKWKLSHSVSNNFFYAMMALNVYESKYYAGLKNISRELTLDEMIIRF